MRRCATAAVVALLALGGCDRAAPRGTAGDGRPAAGPSYLDAAFAPGYQAEVEGRRVTFEARRIGALKVTSGGIVACDPFLCDDAEPFVRPVPNGEFPLVLAIARLGPGHERVALARISFSSRPVVAWERAVTLAQESSPPGPDEVAGYPVDSGTGAFMDVVAWTRYHAEMRGPEGAQRVTSIFTRMANAPWLLPREDGGVAFFRTGWGDGRYASYWGLDADGNPAALVTDFQLVP